MNNLPKKLSALKRFDVMLRYDDNRKDPTNSLAGQIKVSIEQPNNMSFEVDASLFISLENSINEPEVWMVGDKKLEFNVDEISVVAIHKNYKPKHIEKWNKKQIEEMRVNKTMPNIKQSINNYVNEFIYAK